MSLTINQETIARLLTSRKFRQEVLSSTSDLPFDVEALIDMAERTEQKRMVHVSRLMPYTTTALQILGAFDTLSNDFLERGPASPDPSNYYRTASDTFTFAEFTLNNANRLAFDCDYLDDVIRFDKNRLSLFLEPNGPSALPIEYIPCFPRITRFARIDKFEYYITSIIQDTKVLRELLPYRKNDQFILFVRNPNQPEVRFYDVSASAFHILSNCNGINNSSTILNTSYERQVLAHFAKHGFIEDPEKVGC